MRFVLDIPAATTEEAADAIRRAERFKTEKEFLDMICMTVQNGYPLPDDCEILTKEAYSELCLSASGILRERDMLDFIGAMNMCDEISNEAYKKIVCHFDGEDPDTAPEDVSEQKKR